MKRLLFAILVLAVATSLAACGAKDTAEPQFTGDRAMERQLPLSTRLVVGTLQLEGTDNAVTPEQAAELVPLWKGYLALSDSDSASRDELSALADQIAETMTKGQMAFIDGLDGAALDMAGLMEELGIEAPSGAAASEGAPSGQGFRPGGGVPGSGPGGGQLSPEQVSPEQIETLRAERQASGGGMVSGGFTTPLVEKLIEILSAKM